MNRRNLQSIPHRWGEAGIERERERQIYLSKEVEKQSSELRTNRIVGLHITYQYIMKGGVRLYST